MGRRDADWSALDRRPPVSWRVGPLPRGTDRRQASRTRFWRRTGLIIHVIRAMSRAAPLVAPTRNHVAQTSRPVARASASRSSWGARSSARPRCGRVSTRERPRGRAHASGTWGRRSPAVLARVCGATTPGRIEPDGHPAPRRRSPVPQCSDPRGSSVDARTRARCHGRGSSRRAPRSWGHWPARRDHRAA